MSLQMAEGSNAPTKGSIAFVVVDPAVYSLFQRLKLGTEGFDQ